ncbi:MAG: hypothetical protein KGI57_08425 [Hyphomicrobiales bacterium]|nr:hypothetical protein [Hyphomicrobiales bacterium]
MKKLLNAVAVCGLVASAVYVYSIKYNTIFYAERIAKAKQDVAAEEDAISRLRTRWAELARPERVQALASQLLGEGPLDLKQIVKPQDLPARAAAADAIGARIEALGLTLPSTTPGDSAPGGATPQNQ